MHDLFLLEQVNLDVYTFLYKGNNKLLLILIKLHQIRINIVILLSVYLK